MPTKLETIELKLNSANKWEMKVGSGGWHQPPNYPELVVGNNEAGVFTFSIVGSPNVKFAANAFAQKANANPSKPDFGDQFVVVPKGDRELIVVDTNQNKGGGHYPGGKYAYELKFEGAQPLDPIISNTGCCRAFYQTEAFYYSVGIAAAVAIYLLFIRPMLRRNAG